ncbi:AraC family transcriptional regulator [Kordia jejudonensis]|uniref:AraC family transcriptional regulator n=1 Tax=Kordia jejudonensis TaxID=1348245 RepID=UPI00138DEC16|nr:AraC family transcriptional regulator [Kordia jejudonensis]
MRRITKELLPKFMYTFPFKKCRTLLLYILIYYITFTALAQDDTTKTTKLDTIAYKNSLKGKPLRSLALELYVEKGKDSLKASIIANNIENVYISSERQEEIAGAYVTLAVWEKATGNTDKELSLLTKGIKIARELKNDSILYLGLLRKGNVHFDLTNHELALKSYYEALSIAKKEKNKKREIFVKSNIALVRMQAYDRIGAIELFLEIIEEIKEDPSLVTAQEELEIYLNLCGVYTYLEDFDAAIIYCEKGAAIKVDKRDSIDEVHFLSSFAEIARDKKEYEKSHKLLDEAEEIMKKRVGHESLDLFLKFYRGRTYFDEKKYQLAIDELLEIEKIKNKYDVEILSLQQMYYLLAKSYREFGNRDEAMKYYDIAQEIGNKNDKKRDEINNNLIKKYDLVELKDEVEELQRKSQRTKLIYILGITLLIIIIIGLLIFNKKQQQKNKARFALLMQQLEEKRQKGKLRTEVKQADQKTEAIAASKEASETQPAEIDPKMAEILEKLEEFEAKELFLSKDSTLVEVAKKIQTNTTYLSKVINTHKEKSFTSYITDLRVDYAIERLSHDRKFRSFTIGAIAQEIGFKRSESFSKAFKVKTGLYPSYFIKELEKQLNSES